MQQSGARNAGWTLALLALGLVCEGFDLQIANFAAPKMIKALGLTKAGFAPFLSASLFGMLVGAPLFGWLGDRLGRRQVIVAATIAYGLLTLGCTALASFWPLVALRALTGLALGAVLPNIFALANEVAPERLRTKAVAIIGIGISTGGLIAGSTAAALAGAGWQVLFAIAGTVPLVLAAALWAWLPESRRFLETPKRAPLSALFAGPLALITPAIWLVFVGVLMTVYLLTSWLPTMLQDNGLAPASAALVATGYQAGSILGSIVTVLLIGRTGWHQVAAFAALAAVTLAATAWWSGSVAVVAIGLIATGFFVVGAQTGVNGSTSATYSTELRASGLGFGLGIARLGSVLGPLAGGFAATISHDVARTVLAMQVGPLLVAALAAWWIAGRAEAQ